MSTQIQPLFADFLQKEDVFLKIKDIMGDKSAQFCASILQLLSGNKNLEGLDYNGVVNAALTAALLDLPINKDLGFSWIVPYKGNAQFQIGYKGFVQLAQRSGLLRTISTAIIYEGQLKPNSNSLIGYEFDFSVKSEIVSGYAARFELLNGFSKTVYMSKNEIWQHAQKYSQSARKGFGVWFDCFDEMALKTILKLLLSKYAPLSINMSNAIKVDAALILDAKDKIVEYPDNLQDEKEASNILARFKIAVEKCQNTKQLNELLKHADTDEKKQIHADKAVQLLQTYISSCTTLAALEATANFIHTTDLITNDLYKSKWEQLNASGL